MINQAWGIQKNFRNSENYQKLVKWVIKMSQQNESYEWVIKMSHQNESYEWVIKKSKLYNSLNVQKLKIPLIECEGSKSWTR